MLKFVGHSIHIDKVHVDKTKQWYYCSWVECDDKYLTADIQMLLMTVLRHTFVNGSAPIPLAKVINCNYLQISISITNV